VKPSADNAKRKIIPAQVPPTLERICIPVRVPNDPEWIALFVGAVFELTKQQLWDRDAGHLAASIAAVWREVFVQMQASMALGEQCNDLGIPTDGCVLFMPNAAFFGYAPNNPFSTPNLTPPGYFMPPFYTDPLIPLPGVLPTDAMVNFASIPVGATLLELLASGFPRIRIPFQGAGEIEIELVRVPQGGIALVTLDGGIDYIKVVDLNSVSIIGLPVLEDLLDVVLEPNVAETEILEVKTDGAGAHFIDVTFLPNIGGEVLLGFGGGLRRVSYCDLAEPGDVPVPEFRIVNCNLEWRPDDAGGWTILGNVCGAAGEDGQDGLTGASGANANMPVGATIPFAGGAIPAGWLLCDGQAVSRTTYATLFGVIGTTFGVGDGSTTFNVPDMRQRVARGIGTGQGGNVKKDFVRGEVGGGDEHQLVLADLPEHTHGTKRRTDSSAGTSAQLMAASGAGTSEPDVTLGVTGVSSPNDPIDMTPRIMGLNYIICALSVNDLFNPSFIVQDCTLKWNTHPGGEYVDLVALGDCLEPGRTPEFRMLFITPDRQAVQYKYTDEPDVEIVWRTIGYVDDGEPGLAGEPIEQFWRLDADSATRRVLKWRYVTDADIPANYRVVGAWDIPTSEACDCPDIPTPGEVQENPDRCKIAWGLANRISTALIGMVAEYDSEFGFPSNTIEVNFAALAVVYAQGIFLSRINPVTDFMQANWSGIADTADAALFIGELGDIDNIHIVAQGIWSIYDPNFGFTDSHAAIAASLLIVGNIGNRAVQAMAGWLIAPNVEHWQDAILNAAINDGVQDCEDFIPDAPTIGAIFNFEFVGGEIYEDDDTYTTTVKLSLPPATTLGEETRVYYAAQSLTAINGTDFYLPAGFVTFPASSVNGTERTLAFSIFDNDAVDGDRQFRIKLGEVIGTGIIGTTPNHLVTIKDNEDFFLVLEIGASLEQIGQWTWHATSTANFPQTIRIRSMNFDAARCFKLISVVWDGEQPNGKNYFMCGSGSEIPGQPTQDLEIHMLRYNHNATFGVTVTILPA